MNKTQRTQLIKRANKKFGMPFVIEADDEAGETRYGVITTDADARTFINYAARARAWVARDLR